MALEILDAFREKYPQYINKSDKELADALSRKYPNSLYTELPAMVRRSEKSLILDELPPPSIEERTIANTLFTGNDVARRRYLVERGKNPYELGREESAGLKGKLATALSIGNPSVAFGLNQITKHGGPREALADVMESTVPWAKVGGQVGGETLGAAGGVPGIIAGGAVGRGATQTLAEAYAKMRGMAPEEGMGRRIGMETAIGGVTTGIGLGTKAAWRAGGAKVLSMTKKAREYMLTNISLMPKKMQDWAFKRGWGNIYNMAKEPVETLFNKVKTELLPHLKNIKRDLGTEVTRIKEQGVLDKIQPFYGPYTNPTTGRVVPSLVEEVTQDILPNYTGNILITEKNALIKLVTKLSRIRKQSYVRTMDKLLQLNRKVASSYGAETNPLESAIKQIIRSITDRCKFANPESIPVLDNYSKYMGLVEDFEIYIGNIYSKRAPARMTAFIQNNLLADTAGKNVGGQQAAAALFAPEYMGTGTLERLQDLSTAIWMRSGKSMTAGFKAFVPAKAGAIIGGSIGALTTQGDIIERAKGAAKGAAIGGAAGFGLSAPHFTPEWTSAAYRGAEKLLPASRLAEQAIEFGLRYGPSIAGSPLSASIIDIQDRFGVNISDEDIDMLKRSRKEAIGY